MTTRFRKQLARYGPEARIESLSLAEAQAYCRSLAGSHYENFIVASLLLPREVRRDWCVVYAYCRWADDLADEVESSDESLRLLDWWEQQLRNCPEDASHPVFIALGELIRRRQLPLAPLADLLEAFRQDQHKTRYATFEELLAYCRNSANPVGRILLHLSDCDTVQNREDSDRICTGLQLINHWQDVARDFASGRVYLPQESLDAFQVPLDSFPQRSCSPQFRRMLEREVQRAEAMFAQGESLVARVPDWFAPDVALFIAGGRAVASAIRKQNFDVWTRRPQVGRLRRAGMLWQAWRQRLHRGGRRAKEESHEGTL